MQLKTTALFKGICSKLRTAQTQKLLLAMKLTAILMIAACIQVSAKGDAQGISLSAKNASLQKVFKELQKQSGYDILYNAELVQKVGSVSIEVRNVSLQQALEICLKDKPLSYSIVDRTVVIKPKETTSPNEEAIIINNEPPPIDITGKVTDENGNPLAGASVKVKNSSKGTTTNNEGVFVLKGVADDAVLEISYIGYEALSIPVSNRTAIITSLKQKPENLGEVIINKGYYTEKQRNTVGNVGTVTAKDIEKNPVPNVLLAVQGRVPGIEITQLSGLNGGGVQVRIQGRNSITQGLNPLIVVDGVPYPSQLSSSLDGINALEDGYLRGGSPLNYLNPNDIESISILKDADATALYGSRAANGAILITTKKGKAGKNRISLNLQQGWGDVSRHVDMMNTQQYLSMRREALRNANQIASSNPNATAPFTYAPDLTIWDTTRYTDWQKELIGGTAKYTNINASVSGGNQIMQYLIGGTFNRTTTVFPGNFDDKNSSVHFSVSNNSTNQRLNAELSGSYMFDDNHLPGYDLTAIAIRMEPNAPALYKSDGTLNWEPNAAGTSTWKNPLAYTVSTDFINTTKNLVANLNLGYRVAKNLDFKVQFGYTSLQSRIYTPERLELNAPEYRSTAQRDASFQNRNMAQWTIDPQLNYQRKFRKAQIDANIGTSIQRSDANNLIVQGFGFPSDQLMGTLLAATTTYIWSSFSSTERYNALFGRFNFTWNNKYVLNFITRRDGSNKFGDNNKFNNFWSAGVGWVFSDEPGLQKALPFLSFGKVRASYGFTGNDQITNASYLASYSITNPTILYQGGVGISKDRTANPHLQWEETWKLQSGLDLGLFSNRLNLGFTYARNRSSNQLITYPLPAMASIDGAIVRNLPATIQNTSLEFVMRATNVTTKHFSWMTTANLTIPRNEVISFPGIENTVYNNPLNGIVVGRPVGVIWTSKYGGVNPASGKFFIIDKNGNPNNSASSSVSRSIFLDLNTKYYGGISNSFTVGEFQFEFLIEYKRKKGSRDMVWSNGLAGPGQFASSNSNQPVAVLDHWQKPGDIAHSSLYYTSNISIVNATDAFYSYDASYARLKNVSLSWQMPKKWLPNNSIQSARLYAHAQNLATITNYKGIDPESGAVGLPPLRMITVGANVEF